jgi:hypothetical protein
VRAGQNGSTLEGVGCVLVTPDLLKPATVPSVNPGVGVGSGDDDEVGAGEAVISVQLSVQFHVEVATVTQMLGRGVLVG